MAIPKPITTELHLVNIHQVNGDERAIGYLKDADFHIVEALFFRAKLRGRAEFRAVGKRFNLIKNHDLTYSVEEKSESLLRQGSL